MEEKKTAKLSLSTCLLIITIIALGVMGFFMYKVIDEKSKAEGQVKDLTAQIDSLKREISSLQKDTKDTEKDTKNIVGDKKTIQYEELSYKTSEEEFNLILSEENFEIVTNATRMNKILETISNTKYNEKFDESFFKNNNVVVYNGGVQAKINSSYVKNNKLYVNSNNGSPLTSKKDIQNYSIFLFTVSKDVKDVNIDESLYKDRLY